MSFRAMTWLMLALSPRAASAMEGFDRIDVWVIDLAEGVASHAGVVIRFTHNPGEAVQLEFLDGITGFSLDDQCEIAGEAVAAIRIKLRVG